jgi:phytoene dehydrogenase-like protein
VKAIVVGAGHNGLVCACYLALAGVDVTVLEAATRPGGGSRTEETVPGYRFDTHSVAHNIINMTSIPRELRLAAAGLEYREMDPFAVAIFADGRRVRFHRSIERTVASIAEIDRTEAEAYRAFMGQASPLVDLLTLGLQGGATPRELCGRLLRRMPQAVGVLRRGGLRLTSELLGGYGSLLRGRLPSDLTRGPVSAFAAHASAGPDVAGSALFGFWQAAYHRHGQWHAAGGAQGLTDALTRRLAELGGELRCGARVARIDASGARVARIDASGARIARIDAGGAGDARIDAGGGRIARSGTGGAGDARRGTGGARDARRGTGGARDARRGTGGARTAAGGGRLRAVELASGQRLTADAIVTAIHPKTALLELLDPPLSGAIGADLAAAHASNAVQMIVHVAVDRLPAYTNARPRDHNGLQSFVDELGELRAAFRAAEARRVHLPAPAYAFTTSALDDGLAPPGHHTVYLACPAAPFEVQGGWDLAAPTVVESLLDQMQARAPGFRDTIQGIAVRAPAHIARELHWPGAHPMHLDITLDQLGMLRPIPALAGHRTPVPGVYVSGAGSAPTGGIAGGPGRAAARALLRDLGSTGDRE